MQESQRRLLIGLLVAAIVVGAAAVGSRLAGQAASHPTVSRAAGALGTKARVTFHLVGLGGRVDDTTFAAGALGVSRLTPQQLLGEMPGWKMTVAGDRVTLTPKSGAKPLYLGIAQGQVALFFGSPHYGWVDQMTGLRASRLRPKDLSRLQTGVPVQSAGAAWQMLEGLGG